MSACGIFGGCDGLGEVNGLGDAETDCALLCGPLMLLPSGAALVVSCAAACKDKTFTKECFVPSVCKDVASKLPNLIPPEVVSNYCNLPTETQAAIEAQCNAIAAGWEKLPTYPPVVQPYPWGSYSENTKLFQQMLNEKLVGAGLCPLPLTGMLDAATCGAATAVGVDAPATCDAWSAPLECKDTPLPPPSEPPPGEQPKSSAGALLGIGGILTFAVGILWFTRKK
jgi:hypothetical protein